MEIVIIMKKKKNRARITAVFFTYTHWRRYIEIS